MPIDYTDLIPQANRDKETSLPVSTLDFEDLIPEANRTATAVAEKPPALPSEQSPEIVTPEPTQTAPTPLRTVPQKSQFMQGVDVLTSKDDLADIWEATKTIITGKDPFKGKDSRATEYYDMMKHVLTSLTAPVIGRVADAMGMLDYSELKKEMEEEAKDFSGFGEVTVPLISEAIKTVALWGWIYPKLFKLVGVGGETLNKIPAVAKGIQALEKTGGVKILAAKYPRFYQSGIKLLNSIAKGYGAGATLAGLESIGEDLTALETLKEMNSRGAVMGTVAGIFSIADSIDTSQGNG